MDFKNIFELKKRVEPALRKRSRDLSSKSISVTSDQIWEDLKLNKWIKDRDLSLDEIVNDILNYEPSSTLKERY